MKVRLYTSDGLHISHRIHEAGILTHIYHWNQPHVGIYAMMDPMGIGQIRWLWFPQKWQHFPRIDVLNGKYPWINREFDETRKLILEACSTEPWLWKSTYMIDGDSLIVGGQYSESKNQVVLEDYDLPGWSFAQCFRVLLFEESHRNAKENNLERILD